MKTGLTFVLLSGVLLVSCSFTRRFHHVRQKLTWFAARHHCRTHFTDLATVQDDEQFASAKAAAGSGSVWIGMFQWWQWSMEDEGVRSLHGFSNWQKGELRLKKCVRISVEGKWSSRGCDFQSPFICYRAQTDSHFLVPEQLDWFEARSRCRNLSAELSSIRDRQENTAVTEELANQATASGYSHAWIALSRANWKWSDGAKITFSKWAEDQADVPVPRCGAMQGNQNGIWNKRPCGETRHFLCYTDDPHINVRSVKVQLSPGSADLNDPAVREAILQQLKQKLKERDLRGVKLRWKVQPDGKVFHKEEEEPAPPGGDCEDLI